MTDAAPRRVMIERLRITGLAGRAPSKPEIEAALTRAFAAQPGTPSIAPRGPVTLSHGATLGDAAVAAARSVRGKPR